MGARHCEERSDEAIQSGGAGLDCFAALAMTTYSAAAAAVTRIGMTGAP
jgi:hypothetical protein